MFAKVYLIMCRNDFDANTAFAVDVIAFLNKENATVEMQRMQKCNPDLKFELVEVPITDI